MEIKQAIANAFEEEVAALQGLLRIKSVEALGENGTVFGQGAADCLAYVLKRGAELGFAGRDVDGYCGYLEYGAGEELVTVLGHLDVVPEGTGWTYPPYAAEIHDGKIYARGAIDDKGPMMAAMYALKAVKESGAPLKRRVRLLFGLNEETGCECMKHYVEKGEELPAFGFTPDGDFPIIHGEKGICTVLYHHELRPGSHAVTRLQGGMALNAVPAEAEAELNWPESERAKVLLRQAEGVTVSETENGLLVKAKGRSAHGSKPELGVNAIVKLAAFLGTLPLQAESLALVQSIARLYPPNTIGEALGIDLRDEVSGPMVVNLGTAATKDGVVTLGVNLRVPVTFGAEDFHGKMREAMAKADWRESDFHFTEPLYVPADSPLIQKLQKVYERETGNEAFLEVIGGGTYAKTMPNIVAFGPIFPGENCVEHEPDEFIALESLKKMTEIYAAAMVELANA